MKLKELLWKLGLTERCPFCTSKLIKKYPVDEMQDFFECPRQDCEFNNES